MRIWVVLRRNGDGIFPVIALHAEEDAEELVMRMRADQVVRDHYWMEPVWLQDDE